ncbi:MAG TPA: hypothetical protein VHX16_10415 [Chloroflexota bacterium]|nr:hypothetical protein [Chloroflexota bacterium]
MQAPDAITVTQGHGKPLWQDGRWGMATLEVCLAIIESLRERKEVMLSHHMELPAEYDADFDF